MAGNCWLSLEAEGVLQPTAIMKPGQSVIQSQGNKTWQPPNWKRAWVPERNSPANTLLSALWDLEQKIQLHLTWILDLLNHERVNVYVFKLLSLVVICYVALIQIFTLSWLKIKAIAKLCLILNLHFCLILLCFHAINDECVFLVSWVLQVPMIDYHKSLCKCVTRLSVYLRACTLRTLS